MSSYLVSARKYRPQTFSTVVGQEHITTTLKNAIRTGHLAHAFLFTGPRGVGKTSCARILARTINCEAPTPDTEACGVCPTCRSFADNASFNVFELDAASNNSVEDIRELTAQVRFAPQQGRYKIYIIDEVHMLSSQAFNAFLKTLEEPPSYAIFILATTEKHKILPTILSRCQVFDFKRITTADTVAHLQAVAASEGVDAEEASLHVIAQKSEGCMRDALSMLDRIAAFGQGGTLTYATTMEQLSMLDADFYFALCDSLLAADSAGALLQLDGALQRGFEGATILDGLAEHLRNLLLIQSSRTARLIDVPSVHRARYATKAAQSPPAFLISGLALLNDAATAYSQASSKRLHVEMAIIRLAYLLEAVGAPPVVGGQPNPAPVAPAAPAQPAQPKPTAPVVQSAKPATPPISAPTAAGEPAPTYAAPSAPPKAVAAAPVAAATPPPPKSAPRASLPTPAAAPVTDVAKPVRRVSRAMLDDDDLDGPGNATAEAKPLTQETVDEILKDYRQHLSDSAQSVLHAQFGCMAAEVVPPDEVHLVCPNDMAEEYARAQRDSLIDFITARLGTRVRVTTETRLDPNAQSEAPVVLSKQELYEKMATENPSLRTLKEGLNLQVEY